MSIDWESHRKQAEEENIDFLLGLGLSIEAVARRLGLKSNTIEKKLERRAKSNTDPDQVPRSGDAA